MPTAENGPSPVGIRVPADFLSSSASGQQESRQRHGARTKVQASDPRRNLPEQTRSRICFFLRTTCIFPGLSKPGRSIEL